MKMCDGCEFEAAPVAAPYDVLLDAPGFEPPEHTCGRADACWRCGGVEFDLAGAFGLVCVGCGERQEEE